MWQYTLFALGALIIYNYITTGAALLKIQPEVTGFRFYKITLTDTILEIRIRLTNLSTQTITLQGLPVLYLCQQLLHGAEQYPVK